MWITLCCVNATAINNKKGIIVIFIAVTHSLGLKTRNHSRADHCHSLVLETQRIILITLAVHFWGDITWNHGFTCCWLWHLVKLYWEVDGLLVSGLMVVPTAGLGGLMLPSQHLPQSLSCSLTLRYSLRKYQWSGSTFMLQFVYPPEPGITSRVPLCCGYQPVCGSTSGVPLCCGYWPICGSTSGVPSCSCGYPAICGSNGGVPLCSCGYPHICGSTSGIPLCCGYRPICCSTSGVPLCSCGYPPICGTGGTSMVLVVPPVHYGSLSVW